MGRAQQIREAAQQIAQGGGVQQAVQQAVQGVTQQAAERLPGGLDPSDFATARTQGFSTGTRIVQQTTSLENASETLNQSSYQPGPNGVLHVITPMVIPKGRRFVGMLPVLVLAIVAGGWVADTPWGSEMFTLEPVTVAWLIVEGDALFATINQAAASARAGDELLPAGDLLVAMEPLLESGTHTREFDHGTRAVLAVNVSQSKGSTAPGSPVSS